MPKTAMKALIFDLDDTLVVEKASAQAAFLQTCELAATRYGTDAAALCACVRETCRSLWHRSPARAYAVQIGISSWEALWARFEGEDENLAILRAWAPGYRNSSWHEALRTHGVDDIEFAADLAAAFAVNRRRLHVEYDDTRRTLEHFRRSCRLGLLTNGAPDLQREKIAAADIARYFDAIVVSGDVGFGKPDPRIFRVMLSGLQVAPEETLMIGDTLISDIQGAQAVGMKAAWVNRAGHTRSDDIIPDLEVSSLDELRQALVAEDRRY